MQHNHCFPISINNFKSKFKQITVVLGHAKQSLSTQKAGLLETNYSVSEDGQAKKCTTLIY